MVHLYMWLNEIELAEGRRADAEDQLMHDEDKSGATASGDDENPTKDAAESAGSESKAAKPENKPETADDDYPDPAVESGGPKGLEPTRYGDWERKGILSDF